jgi:hypothetical protein
MGEFLTRATIWTTIIAYAVGAVIFALAYARPRWSVAARLAWTIACASLIAHFISAFHYYHAWSHSSAYLDTARQTNQVFGLNWGGGLFINYGLLTLWLLDVGAWWLHGIDSYRRRSLFLIALWHAFLIFILFNATVVFKQGAVRWIGLIICAGLCLSWWLFVKQRLTRVTN